MHEGYSCKKHKHQYTHSRKCILNCVRLFVVCRSSSPHISKVAYVLGKSPCWEEEHLGVGWMSFVLTSKEVRYWHTLKIIICLT